MFYLIQTIRKHPLSTLTLVLFVLVMALLSEAAANSEAPIQLHNIARTSTCAKNVTKYQYAQGSLQPENEYLEATTYSCRANAPWIIAYHGGSWINGTPASLQSSVDGFFSYGWNVFNVEYRRGTNIPWNLQKNDIMASYNWVVAHAAALGIDPNKGTAFGFSAGGHMAAWLGNLKPISSVLSVAGVLRPNLVAEIDNGMNPLEPTTAATHNLHTREVTMMGCDYTPLMTTTCSDNWDAFDPETAVNGRNAPIYAVQGSDDPVLPRDTASSYSDIVTQSGKPSTSLYVDGYGHDYYMLFDGTTASNARFYNVRHWIANQW